MIIARRAWQNTGGLAAVKLLVNDKKVAALGNGEEHQFSLPVGRYNVYFRYFGVKSNIPSLDKAAHVFKGRICPDAVLKPLVRQ